MDLAPEERRALRDKRLHDEGYVYCWPPRIGNLTPRQAKRVELWTAVTNDIERRQHEQSRNSESLSHEYDVAGSRREAFNG